MSVKTPEGWELTRLRFKARVNPKATFALDPAATVSFLPMDAIGDDGTLRHDQVRVIEDVSQGYTYFENGDVSIAKITPCFENGKGAVMADLVGGIGFGTTELIVMRPEEGVDSRFVYYLTQSSRFRLTGAASMLGAGGQKRVSDLYVKDFLAPWPPLHTQVAIAAYLDTETKRIDWLVKEKENLIKLLVELRGGIIRELTAGIHLGSSMQQTGNVFMPAIPSDWDMSGIGRFSSIGNGSTPLKDNEEYWVGGTYPWLNSSVVNEDEVIEGSELVTEKALKLCHLPIVQAGSVLVALTGQGKTRGQATMLRIEATINQHLAYIQTDGERLDGEYLFWVLSGQFSALRMISDGQGGTKGALTCDDLRKFQIPLPPIAVQKEIAARLYEDTRRVDELVEYAKNEIRVLAELRSSTITDAVLGRIDVRKTQAH